MALDPAFGAARAGRCGHPIDRIAGADGREKPDATRSLHRQDGYVPIC